jgi:hypothetical protein
MPAPAFDAGGQFVGCFRQPGQAGCPLLQRGRRPVHRLDVRQVGQPDTPSPTRALPGRSACSATFGKVLLGARQRTVGTQDGRPMRIGRVEGQQHSKMASSRFRARDQGRVEVAGEAKVGLRGQHLPSRPLQATDRR